MFTAWIFISTSNSEYSKTPPVAKEEKEGKTKKTFAQAFLVDWLLPD